MKLKFDKSGRRFFFLTFCVRGRRPILSKLVTGRDESGKLTASVVLTELGEKIAALWRGVHARHPALDPALVWTAIGDLTLLGSPFMFPVRLTRKMTIEQHQPEIARMVELAKMGMVPVCGFLSPGEKELERQLRLEPDTRWIKTVAHGLPARFDPTVEDSRYLAEGRQLFLSSFPVDVPVFPVNYDNCHLMNARNEDLCERASGMSANKQEVP